MASSTYSSVAIGLRDSLAKDSVMRMIASSWRTVIGMLDRVDVESSWLWTCLRMETKCEESFSLAAGERRGAQRLLEISPVSS